MQPTRATFLPGRKYTTREKILGRNIGLSWAYRPLNRIPRSKANSLNFFSTRARNTCFGTDIALSRIDFRVQGSDYQQPHGHDDCASHLLDQVYSTHLCRNDEFKPLVKPKESSLHPLALRILQKQGGIHLHQ